MNALHAGEPDALLRVEGLTKHFPVRGGVLFRRTDAVLRAVDNVSFTVASGETLGLVGESGCGKSTVGRMLLRLVEPTAGRVEFLGDDMTTLSPAGLRARRRDIQIIFQDPYGALNPRMTVADIIMEPLLIHGARPDATSRARVAELLAKPRMRRRKTALQGEIPSALDPPKGCRFHTRCPHVMPVCREVEPMLSEPASGHRVACHLVDAAPSPGAR